jgi:hypothetical protein
MLVSVPFLVMGTASFAGELPAVKISEANPVPACATPGRLMSYIKQRNTKLDAKFDVIATEYMRHGEALQLRWDYAFFQMLLETGYLTYTGDVKPSQNNFAGLGATGGGARGESFKDVSTGVRAHLEHLLMYSGEKIENPVAERTRNIQEWGVLDSWQKTIKGPMTFTQLAKQWAPTSRGYARDIDSVAQRFFNGPCNEDDPQPELVAEARGQVGAKPMKTAATAKAAPASAKTDARGDSDKGGAPAQQAAATAEPASKGVEAARRSIDDAKGDNAQRFALGATAMAGAASPPPAQPAAGAAAAVAETKPAAASPPVTLLNGQPAESKADAPLEVASIAGMAKDAGKPEKTDTKAANSKCRVWTASYGGNKAIIIKAMAEKTVNYTVLDVNEGTEKREADAYISAYAKGGEAVGEFESQSQALEKAFELCPEG